MAEPTFKNPASGGLTLAGGQKPLMRVYGGYYPEDNDDPDYLKRSRKGQKFYWDENLKGLGAHFNADEWEEAGQVNWTRNPQTGKYELSRAGDMGILNPDLDPFDRQSHDVQAAMLKGRPAGITGTVSEPSPSKTTITPADVKAAAKTSPAAAAQQKSVAEQQAEYIRSKGGRTAAEADAEFESNLRKDYSEATGFDINTAEGRRKSFQAALQRGGHANARALNMRAGKYAYLDPNSDAGRDATYAAYEKAWGQGGQWDKGERTGENPLNGAFKDREGGEWTNHDTFYKSQFGGVTEEPTFSWEQPNFDAAADAVRLNGGSPAPQDEYNFDNVTAAYGYPQGYFDNPSSAPQQAAPSPLQASSDAAQKRIRDAFVTGTSQPEASKNIMPAFDKLDASLKTAADAVRNIGRDTWTPEKGGYKGGVWYSAADSEPEAGGNYGTPRLFDTWTPEAGGRVNNVNYSRADSEPQAGGNYGKTPLIPSRTRPIMQPSRAALLGPRSSTPSWSPYVETSRNPDAKRARVQDFFNANAPYLKEYGKPKSTPITPWQGYGDQM